MLCSPIKVPKNVHENVPDPFIKMNYKLDFSNYSSTSLLSNIFLHCYVMLLTFVWHCQQMKAIVTLFKCETICERIFNYRNYHLFLRFQGGFHVWDFFNITLIFFAFAQKTFYEQYEKHILFFIFYLLWFCKKLRISKKVIFSDDEHEKWKCCNC